MCMLSHAPLFCGHSPLGSCVHGIFQAGILEWVAFPSPVDLLDPGVEPTSLGSPALQANSLSPESSEKLICICKLKYIFSQKEIFSEEETEFFYGIDQLSLNQCFSPYEK